ncbi:MAG: argininosuccinate lyase [Flavobacteriales bacterium]|nr:argininosuccinate lyase [Flavobacteriales bacterium]MCB9449484.1 argininosuccinate lyase [Flavobacteriales bacterium]
MAKIWDKGFSVDQKVESFTVGADRELDMELAPFDVLGSIAHTTMLAEVGLLQKEESQLLRKELISIYREIEQGTFRITDDVEDVHSQVEAMLTERLGEVGKKIHSGRSRNDQVLVDLKLFLRDHIRHMAEDTGTLVQQLLQLSEKHKHILMPGYTHMQIAMPSSFGLWFGAYAESLADDLSVLQAAWRIVNRNPLGSAAGYGSSFPLDREMTTRLLGFDGLNVNVVYAQMGRGKAEKVTAVAMAAIASTLARMAMDMCLFMNQNFGFVSFPKELTTGSSIMPHKKNPDVWEIMRGRCNQLRALPTEIDMITGNLPSGYHRELQLMKENLFPAIHHLSECLHMAGFMLEHIEVKKDILADDKYRYLFSVEEVNRLVLEGVPFRDAYKRVGASIEAGTFQTDRNVSHQHLGSIGNLGTEQITSHLNTTLKAFDFKVMDAAVAALLNS